VARRLEMPEVVEQLPSTPVEKNVPKETLEQVSNL
jgi:hypothetical protein